MTKATTPPTLSRKRAKVSSRVDPEADREDEDEDNEDGNEAFEEEPPLPLRKQHRVGDGVDHLYNMSTTEGYAQPPLFPSAKKRKIRKSVTEISVFDDVEKRTIRRCSAQPDWFPTEVLEVRERYHLYVKMMEREAKESKGKESKKDGSDDMNNDVPIPMVHLERMTKESDEKDEIPKTAFRFPIAYSVIWPRLRTVGQMLRGILPGGQ